MGQPVHPQTLHRGVPRGWSGNTLLGISPSGQWIAYQSRDKYNAHFSIYNLVTGEWRSPQILFQRHEVRWDADESGLYYLGFPMGETPEDRRLWRIDLSLMWVEVVRKCPYCVSFDVSEATSTLAVMRSIEPGRQQVDVVGWTKPFTEAVTVDVVARESVGGISLSPGGKRLAYSTAVEPKRPRVFAIATRVADLSSGAIVTLGENYMDNAPWLSDDIILDPDPDALRVWKHNLTTGERGVFAEVEDDLSSVYVGQRTYVGMGGAALARETRMLLFTPTVSPEYRFSSGDIFVADLRCSRMASGKKK